MLKSGGDCRPFPSFGHDILILRRPSMSDRIPFSWKVYFVIESDKDGIRRRCLRVHNLDSELRAVESSGVELTKQAIPGVLEYEGARIQLLDLPGIVQDAAKGELYPLQRTRI